MDVFTPVATKYLKQAQEIKESHLNIFEFTQQNAGRTVHFQKNSKICHRVINSNTQSLQNIIYPLFYGTNICDCVCLFNSTRKSSFVFMIMSGRALHTHSLIYIEYLLQTFLFVVVKSKERKALINSQ